MRQRIRLRQNHFQLDMPSPTYNQREYPEPCQTDFKEYSPSIATNSIDTGLSVSSNKERDIEFAHSEDGLPPVDGGTQAWLFLLASAMLEALVWGELFCGHGPVDLVTKRYPLTEE